MKQGTTIDLRPTEWRWEDDGVPRVHFAWKPNNKFLMQVFVGRTMVSQMDDFVWPTFQLGDTMTMSLNDVKTVDIK